MPDETQTEEEPSIEEILDSIRQIISEDDDDGASAEVSPEEAPVEVAEAPEEEPEPMDQSAIDDMDFDAPVAEEAMPEEPMDQSAIDDMDFDTPSEDVGEGPLELTDQVATGEGELEVDMVDEPEAEDVPDTELTSEPEASEKIPEPEPEAVEEIPEPAPESTPEPADDILTDQAKEAAFSAMSELVRKTAVDHTSSLTIEDIVRSELKPLLRSWLDEHLPTVIDRLVREELERVSKRVLED